MSPTGLLQPLPVPVWKWENITMDFMVGLPRTASGHDDIWVIVDRLTKSAHFVPIRVTYGPRQLADFYLKQVIRLHGVPKDIISDRDSRYVSHFRLGL